MEELCGRIRNRLTRELEGQSRADDREVRERIARLVLEESRSVPISVRERSLLSRRVFASVRRLDILQELMEDSSVTEIMVNGRRDIFFEREGRLARWDRCFADEESLEDVIRQIAGRCNRVINERSPIVDARLEDGSRVCALVPPAAVDGPVLVIRKFPSRRITMKDLVEKGSLTGEASDFLSGLLRAGYSVLVGGGTSAGKTTFLNALSESIPKRERVVTIEDNAELQLMGIENLVRLEAKKANTEDGAEVTIRDLIKASLRMRPDRIIVGEVRGGEAVDMLQALNTGHDGSMSTIHANSCADMLNRLEVMALLGEPGLPAEAVRRQIASGVEILVHLGRGRDGKRRVLEIAEIMGYKKGEILLSPLFVFDRQERRLIRRGVLQNAWKWETMRAYEE